ncbi:Na+/H+ antiporter subunit E [Arthrobacter subterraneus]|uniref:Na+/H+ antiporter subunit E n=1 Tax=Arthrobacter subterraneus TaxID=335973 RepID=UPI00380BC214
MRSIAGQVVRVVRVARFSVWFAWLVVKASLEVAVDAVTPRSRLRTGIIAYPAACRTRAEVSTFAALVNLTPGTLTLAVRDGHPPLMYIHAMYAPDHHALETDLRLLETRYLDAVRRREAP